MEAVAESLDPEETSFVFTRSIEQHAGGIESDGDIRVERILNWTRWEFSELAVDQKTSCFVRDLLSRLKLLDVDSGRFQVGLFITMIQNAGNRANRLFSD